MADWSVKITRGPGGKIVYQAQLQPDDPPGTLYTSPGDTVSWNNQCGSKRQPTLTQINGSPATPGAQGTPLYLSDPIANGHSSRPSWVAPKTPDPGTYTYVSSGHTSETGVIIVQSPPKPGS